MQNHQSAWPFQKPVNPEEVPDYYNVITEAMDLETMEKRLEEDAYGTPEEFIRDAKLIFNNCRRYNNETTSYWKNANKLEKFMNSKLREIPEWSVGVTKDLYDKLLTANIGVASCRVISGERCAACPGRWVVGDLLGVMCRALMGTDWASGE
jgi:hypothetical protein